jgi:hypothetical protein
MSVVYSWNWYCCSLPQSRRTSLSVWRWNQVQRISLKYRIVCEWYLPWSWILIMQVHCKMKTEERNKNVDLDESCAPLQPSLAPKSQARSKDVSGINFHASNYYERVCHLLSTSWPSLQPLWRNLLPFHANLVIVSARRSERRDLFVWAHVCLKISFAFSRELHRTC